MNNRCKNSLLVWKSTNINICFKNFLVRDGRQKKEYSFTWKFGNIYNCEILVGIRITWKYYLQEIGIMLLVFLSI